MEPVTQNKGMSSASGSLDAEEFHGDSILRPEARLNGWLSEMGRFSTDARGNQVGSEESGADEEVEERTQFVPHCPSHRPKDLESMEIQEGGIEPSMASEKLDGYLGGHQDEEALRMEDEDIHPLSEVESSVGEDLPLWNGEGAVTPSENNDGELELDEGDSADRASNDDFDDMSDGRCTFESRCCRNSSTGEEKTMHRAS